MPQASMMEKTLVNWKIDTLAPLLLQTHPQEDNDDHRHLYHQIQQVLLVQ